MKPISDYLTVYAYLQLLKWRKLNHQPSNMYPSVDDLDNADYYDLKRELMDAFMEANNET